MFGRDPFGLNPELPPDYATGKRSYSRFDIARDHYSRKKLERLEAEFSILHWLSEYRRISDILSVLLATFLAWCRQSVRYVLLR